MNLLSHCWTKLKVFNNNWYIWVLQYGSVTHGQSRSIALGPLLPAVMEFRNQYSDMSNINTPNFSFTALNLQLIFLYIFICQLPNLISNYNRNLIASFQVTYRKKARYSITPWQADPHPGRNWGNWSISYPLVHIDCHLDMLSW